MALGLATFVGSAFLIRAALARPHPHAPVKPLAAAGKTDCGCGAAPKGRRIRLLKRDANGSPSIGPDNTYDVIIPDAARWQAVHVQAGAEEWFGANVPLPFGPNPTDGGWYATYGRISRDGTHYQAPFDVPPDHLDIISYQGPSIGATVKEVQFLVYVDGSILTYASRTLLAPSAQATTGEPQANGTAVSGQAPLGLPAQEAASVDADASDFTADLDCDCDAPTTVNAVDNLLESAPDQISPLPDNDFWPVLAAAPFLPAAQTTVGLRKMEVGYPIPSWASNPGRDAQGNERDVIIGIRQKNPITKRDRKNPVVKCKQTRPFNDPPPFPIDPKTGRPVLHYSCVPGVKYDMPNDAQPHWRCKPAQMTGWSTIGHFKGKITAEASANIKEIFDVKLDTTTEYDFAIKSAEIKQTCTRYVDHYTCGNDGKSWVYTGSEGFQRDGSGFIYNPAWYGYFAGYPADGVKWRSEYPTGPVHSPN